MNNCQLCSHAGGHPANVYQLVSWFIMVVMQTMFELPSKTFTYISIRPIDITVAYH